MKLSDTRLRALREPGKHFDGGGLYLEVTAAGGRYWRMKYRFDGKEKRLAFGVYPEVSLKEARQRRDDARRLLANGQDPAVVKKVAKEQAVRSARNTFEAVAQDWLQHQRAIWTSTTAARALAALQANVFPAIGSTPIDQLKPRDVMQLVKAVEERGAGEMAARVLQRIQAIFRYAVVHERLEANPMMALKASELLKPRQVTHRLALQAEEVPAFLQRLATYQGEPTTLAALRFLMLTVVRPGELRGARWVEIDEVAAEWRIPAERMKMRSPHIVPLSHQALAVLAGMRPLSGHRELVFPSPFYPGKPLSENTLNGALARMGYKGHATAHGFRALFSTVANEQGWDADVIERQLAHIERNRVRAAYHRATYLQDRARLMQWWADYIDAKAAGTPPPAPIE